MISIDCASRRAASRVRGNPCRSVWCPVNAVSAKLAVEGCRCNRLNRQFASFPLELTKLYGRVPPVSPDDGIGLPMKSGMWCVR